MKEVTGKQLLLLCLMRHAPVVAKNSEIYDHATEGGSQEQEVRTFYFLFKNEMVSLVSTDLDIIWWNPEGIFYTGMFKLEEEISALEDAALELIA